MTELKIEQWPIDQLIPYCRNPRKNDEAVPKMAGLIKEFGFKVPIVARSDGEVIDGHLRLKAARHLGLETVPVVLADDWTSAQVKAFRLAVNKSAEWAEWDEDLLALEIEDLKLEDFDLELIGFEELSLDGEETEGLTDPDEVPEVQETPVSKLGDIWLLGNHRLMCGDSTDAGSVALLMNGEKADLAFYSPPYNVGKNAQLNDRDDDNKYVDYNDENPEYLELLNQTTKNALDISNFVAINIQMLSGNKRDFISWLFLFKDNLCDIAIWYKDNVAPAMARRVMNSSFEFIILFAKEKPSRAFGTNDFRGTVSNVYQSHIQTNNEYNKIHAATFPVVFAEHYISDFTNSDETVLDLFGGSGSTLIACEKTGRVCRMMELSPRYVDVIVRRWQDFTGKEATLEASGKTFAQVQEERG